MFCKVWGTMISRFLNFVWNCYWVKLSALRVPIQRDTQWVGPHWLCLNGFWELSVLETHHPWCLFLAMSLEIKTAPSVSLWTLVWCGALYIPCASQSHSVTMTGEINHAMNILFWVCWQTNCYYILPCYKCALVMHSLPNCHSDGLTARILFFN